MKKIDSTDKIHDPLKDLLYIIPISMSTNDNPNYPTTE